MKSFECVLEISFKRKDGVRVWNCRCKVKRFKELWSYFKNRWVWCDVMKLNENGKVIGEWIWYVDKGWINVNE